ncbi:MAG: hypothetical protein C0598_04845 [Marinilabiliales bacterium]|nr:MAG: hypothetical protein C0598_04845 [Marinilabiliales bacterium]
MKCNGKCHLQNELKKTEEPVDAPKTEFVQLRNEVLFYQHSHISTTDINLTTPELKFIYVNADCYKSEFVNKIFHPPQTTIV